jgi:predicted amidophosphoribosyltransferase
LPLDATEADSCGVCLACAVVAYGDIARSFAIPLKCGRMVAVAQTITRYVASLIEQSGGATIPVPVPLNRTRLWQRGFNQSALVAKELSSRLELRSDPNTLRRLKRTRPLKGMNSLQRRKTVAVASVSPTKPRPPARRSSASTMCCPRQYG